MLDKPGGKFRILIATDAWRPQVNGVVRTLEMLGRALSALGHDLKFVTPEGHLTVPLPTYPEIRLAVVSQSNLKRQIRDFSPDAIHIATEGPIGLRTRSICLNHGISFTTSYFTKFPEYARLRIPFLPVGVVYRLLRRFHRPASATMVATQSLERELEHYGFSNLVVCPGGVDAKLFRPVTGADLPFTPPVWLYVGRIAVEKNIGAFLSLDLPGTKVLVGDGPARGRLEQSFPNAKFLGVKSGEDLVRHYSKSDVVVFPSRTDTLGLVVLEALASGTPFAAYPVAGLRELIGDAPVAALDWNLGKACLGALTISRDDCRAFGGRYSWDACARAFLANLALIS